MFKPVAYTPEFYPILAKWWNDHDWPAIPQDALPKTGIVITNEENPIVAGFLYKTDSTMAWMEYIVADAKSDKMIRSEALDMLIDCLLFIAKENGFKTVFTSSVHPSLIARKQKHGFIVGDTNTTQLIRSL